MGGGVVTVSLKLQEAFFENFQFPGEVYNILDINAF